MSLSEIEKVAVLLIALGPQRARRILDRLGTNDLLPIIQAMKRMRSVDPDVRNRVLEEVNDILSGLSGTPDGDTPTVPMEENAEASPNLFDRLGPYLPEQIDPDGIDWDRAGFDFDDSEGKGPTDVPPQEDPS